MNDCSKCCETENSKAVGLLAAFPASHSSSALKGQGGKKLTNLRVASLRKVFSVRFPSLFGVPLVNRWLATGLEIDNENVKNNSILDTSKNSSEFPHSITKIKSREYRSIDNVTSILFSNLVNSVNIF